MAKVMSFADARVSTIVGEMRRDPTIFIFGQGTMTAFGYSGASSEDLNKEFGQKRIQFSPISETAMTGVGIGAALTGTRPIVEHALSDFIMVAAEQFINEAARIRFKLGGEVECPVVFRIGYGLMGAGLSVQHSNCYYNKFADTPGLILAIPSTPADVSGLWRTALRGKNPVMIWESGLIGGVKGSVPGGDYMIPFGKGDVKREGSDVTIAAIAYCVHQALEAAEELAEEGIDAEVWDPRTLTPFDRDGLINSVFKTGALVVVDEEPKSFGTTGEFAMTVAEVVDPVPPMARVTLEDASIAFSPPLEQYVMPSKDKIIKAVREVLERKGGAGGIGMKKD